MTGKGQYQHKCRSCLRVNQERGVTMVWSAGISLAVFSLVSLAITVLWLFSSVEQVAQFGDYHADATLREYQQLRDDPRFVDSTSLRMTAGGELERIIEACEYGYKVAQDRLENLPFARVSFKKPLCRIGLMRLPPDPDPYVFDDTYPEWLTHYDKNAVEIQVDDAVNHGPWSFLLTFVSNSSSRVRRKIYAVYDERLLAKGMYAYLVFKTDK